MKWWRRALNVLRRAPAVRGLTATRAAAFQLEVLNVATATHEMAYSAQHAMGFARTSIKRSLENFVSASRMTTQGQGFRAVNHGEGLLNTTNELVDKTNDAFRAAEYGASVTKTAAEEAKTIASLSGSTAAERAAAKAAEGAAKLAERHLKAMREAKKAVDEVLSTISHEVSAANPDINRIRIALASAEDKLIESAATGDATAVAAEAVHRATAEQVGSGVILPAVAGANYRELPPHPLEEATATVLSTVDNELTASMDRVGTLLSFGSVNDAGRRLDKATEGLIDSTANAGDKLGNLLQAHLKETENKVGQTLAPVSEQAKSGNWAGWY